MNKELKKFIIFYFESLLILVIMGTILPYLVDIVLTYITRGSRIYHNSILVSKYINKQLEILYRYIYVFRAVLR